MNTKLAGARTAILFFFLVQAIQAAPMFSKAAKFYGKAILFGSKCGAVGGTVGGISDAYRVAKDDPKFAADIVYGKALIGAISGFQFVAAAPIVIPQDIAFELGLCNSQGKIVQTSYTATKYPVGERIFGKKGGTVGIAKEA